jgi:hypothetical protein
MASGKRDPSSTGPNARSRRRRAPTIDLKATEIDPGASEPSQEAPPQAAAASTESRATPETFQGAAQTAHPAVGEEPPAKSADEPTEPPPAAGRTIGWLPIQLSRQQLVAGAVGGAIVLAVVAAIWIVGLVQIRNDDESELASRLGVLEVQVRDLNDRVATHTLDPKAIEDVLSRLTTLENTVAAAKTTAPDADLVKRVTAAESAAVAAEKTAEKASKSLDVALKEIDRRLKDLKDVTTTAGSARQRADAAAAAVAELEKKIAAVPAGQIQRGDLDRLADRVSKLESAAKALQHKLAGQTTSGSGDRAARLAVAAGALRSAVERGRPYAVELNAVKSLADDAGALAPLAPFAATGLPDKAALARDLFQLLPALRRVAGLAAGEGGILQRLQSNAEKLVRIRPVNDVAGDDAAAIISRIETRAGRADIAGALAELAKLPPRVRAPAEAWIAKAKARMAAEGASRRFMAQAIAALGKSP